MRATIKNYIEAAKQRREENGEGGFSLIELIVVVAILGILVAIAIPVFGNIQATARDNAVKTAAANGATVAATALAQETTPNFSSLISGDITAVTFVNSATATLDNVCVSATGFSSITKFAGPGAKPDGSACK